MSAFEGDLSQTGKEISILSRRIDSIDAILGAYSNPWYKNPANFVSIAALIFSFGTTYFSYKRNDYQDIQAQRAELRQLLQRIAAIGKENFENSERYTNDPAAFSMISGFLAHENSILSKQAAETISRLPLNKVSSTDLYAVGISLQNNRVYDRATEMFVRAADTASGLDDEIAALRSLGNIKFLTTKPGEGRVYYQKSLDIFDKYKGYDAFTIASTQVLTELNWAIAEFGGGFAQNSEQHFQQAEIYAASIAAGPGQQFLRSQVIQTKNQTYSGTQVLSVPVTSPSSDAQSLKAIQEIDSMNR